MGPHVLQWILRGSYIENDEGTQSGGDDQLFIITRRDLTQRRARWFFGWKRHGQRKGEWPVVNLWNSTDCMEEQFNEIEIEQLVAHYMEQRVS